MALPTVFLLGDSICGQYFPYVQQYLRGTAEVATKQGLKEALADWDTPRGANCGDSGNVVLFLEHLERKGGFAPDLLLINAGLHDVKIAAATGARQVSAGEYRRNLEATVALAARMALRLTWVLTTPVDDAQHNERRPVEFRRHNADVLECNAAAREIMDRAGVPLLDLYTFTLAAGPDLYCDHVHFHSHVRERQAAFIAGYVQGILATAGAGGPRA